MHVEKDSVLSTLDLNLIEDTVLKSPIGSNEAAEIVDIAGVVMSHGVSFSRVVDRITHIL